MTALLLAAANNNGEVNDIAYILLLLGGVAALLGAAYLAYRSQIVPAVAVALIGIVMIVLAT